MICENTWCEHENKGKNEIISRNREKFQNLIFHQLDLKKNLVIVCQSSNEVEEHKKIFSEKYQSLTIATYTGSSTTEKQIQELNDVVENWMKVNVLIYSPTIESGVNFDVEEHFDVLFIITSNMANSQSY